MNALTHKTTILLTPSEHRHLVAEARRRKVTLGELFRRAVRSVYHIHKFPTPSSRAWNKLFALKAPVGDWDEMENEITRGRLES